MFDVHYPTTYPSLQYIDNLHQQLQNDMILKLEVSLPNGLLTTMIPYYLAKGNTLEQQLNNALILFRFSTLL